jgi:hypothetical protein
MFTKSFFPSQYFEPIYFVNVFVNVQTEYSDVTNFVLDLKLQRRVDQTLAINRKVEKPLEINRQLEFTVER